MMPLSARSFIDAAGEQKIGVWYDRKEHIVSSPFLPYCYTLFDLRAANPNIEFVNRLDVVVKPLSNPEVTKCYKYEFKTTAGVSAVNDAIKESHFNHQVYESHIRFTHRIRIDKPDWFAQFKTTKKLRILTFDIETLTDDGIPKPEVISIAVGWHSHGKHRYDCLAVKDIKEEKQILQKFVEFIKRYNPDIIVGYNSIGYDFPRIIQRMKFYGMDTRQLSRDNTKPRFWETQGEDGTEYHGMMGGRVLFDVWHHVKRDQQLDDASIKNDTLGSIAAHFGFKFLPKLDMTNTIKYVGTKALRRVNVQDVKATEHVFKIYWPTIKELSEYLKVPIDMANSMKPLDTCSIWQGSDLHSQLYVADKANQYRHPFIDWDKPRKKYQAAVVKIAATGHYKDVSKIDFSGMYSALEIAFNLSPETTRIKKLIEYKEGLPSIVKQPNNFLLMVIPDNIVNKIILIEVDCNKMGMLKERLLEVRAIRKKLKTAMKAEKNETKAARLKSRQGAYKLLLNLPSGTNANKHMYFGDLAVTIATVGMARMLITNVMNEIEKAGGKIIEVDTDGIYYSGKVSLETIQKILSDDLAKYGLKEIPELDQDFYPQAYFLKMKNYMLYTEDNKIIPKGSSLKGKHKSKMFDLAIEKIADVIFRGKDVSWEQIGDISQYKKEDLLMRTTMSMAPEEYSNKNCLQMQLYRQALTLKMEPVPGTSFEYYKSVNGYMLSQNKSNAPPDHKYYGSIVKRILKLFDKNPKERSLSEFKPKKELHEYM